MIGCHDNGRLVIGVVFGEVADGLKNVGCLVSSEDVVSTPDLLDVSTR